MKAGNDRNPVAQIARVMTSGVESVLKEGQQELVHSEYLPVEGSEDPEVQALGIEWGEIDPADPLFRRAKLPDRWIIRATPRPMWSEIVDSDANVRAKLFFKCLSFDRRARIEAPSA